MDDKELLEQLSAEFPREELGWLPKLTQKKDKSNYMKKGIQVAMCLAHLDSRHIQNRLDEVLGPFGWSDDYVPGPIGNSIKCYLTIKMEDKEVTKSDVGVPSAFDKEKGAISDALKRAAVKYGIGRYLYSFEARWIPFDGYKTVGSNQEQISELVALSNQYNTSTEAEICQSVSDKRASYFEELTVGEAVQAINGLKKRLAEKNKVTETKEE